jgi:putative CocE/NonD family hydrolase
MPEVTINILRNGVFSAMNDMRNPRKNNAMPPEIDFTWGVKIPMRDGVRLNTTLYKLKSSEPTPAIFSLTPYTLESSHGRGIYFAQQGYTFAVVDSRGRGNSEGIFEPFASEAEDGNDIVEWLAVQPWCDGQVAMWGGSYGGYDQWLTLREAPPHLKTIVPVASAHAAVDFPFFANILSCYEMQWLTFTSGVTRNTALMDDSTFWIGKFQEMYQNHLPYKELDQIVGNHSTFFQTWVKHPHPDAYWEKMALSASQYDRISIPILTITGHYDADQPGAMEYYRRHISSQSKTKEAHYLIIGPWDHPGTRDPKPLFGGLKFGEASLLDMNKLHKEWYDWTMKEGKKPAFLKKRVAYYVTGEEKWKYAENLVEIPTRAQKMYLGSDNGARDVFHSGSLEAKEPKEAGTDIFTYDPLDKRFGDLERKEIPNYLTDQTYDLNLFGNGLVYHSEPFTKATEITGWVKLFAWMELDVPDTDFTVLLSEVLPDGEVIKLTQDFLRARYRESKRVEKLVIPGEINLYTFEGFTFFSRRIARGSRLRLIISCPNTIYLEKNYNGGGVVAEESARDARIAHVILYHDAEHPSHLELPMIR